MLCQELPPVGGGGGRAALGLARQWARCHHVDYVTERSRGFPAREVLDGVHVYRAFSFGRHDLDAAAPSAHLAYAVSGVACGLGLLAHSRYDIINSHFAVPSGALGLALSAVSRTPHVASVHGADVYEPFRRLSPNRCWPVGMAVRLVLGKACCVVAQSRDTAQRVLDHCGEGIRRKLRVIPLGFDPAQAAPFMTGREAARAECRLEAGARYIVSVGRLVRRKGFDRLIQAMAYLPQDVRLVIVGSGPLRGGLEELARRAGLTGRVRLAGHVTDKLKYGYLSAADAFVLSSEHEGFGVVLQEAMAAGLPVVAVRHGGQADLLEDGVNALLVDSNEPRGLAGAVQRVLADSELRAAMREANRRKLKAYNASAMAQRYVQLFREAVASAGSGRPSAWQSAGRPL